MPEFTTDNNSITHRRPPETLLIEPYGPDILRVRATINPEFSGRKWMLLDPGESSPSIEISDSSASITNGRIRAVVEINGRITFYNEKNEIILEEPAYHSLLIPSGRNHKTLGSELSETIVRFKSREDEKIYGLGQHRHGYLDQKGCVIPLEQRNSEIAIPFALSSLGYGFIWNNPAIGHVEFAKNETRWIANACPEVDYLVFTGVNTREIIEKYADLTGHPPKLPKFASGFWQCKLRYKTQDELLNVAREYKKRGLPISVIVIDFFHWKHMGEWRFDPDDWPDSGEMVRELDEMNIKLMVSIWPAVGVNSENFKEMEEKGFLVRTERGIPLFQRFREKLTGNFEYLHYYDATNPDAGKYVWSKVRDNYFRHGIKVWWLDAIEPEMYPYHPENVRFNIGNGNEVGCFYPVGQQRAFYEGMISEGEEEIITLGRSAWLGSQRYGAAVWSGDIFSTFECLRQQVRAGLNIGLSGIPWWTTDIGGFLHGRNDDPTFRELIVRWFQYGTFCPLFRLHGCREPFGESTGADNEVWSFGDEAYEIIAQYLHMRERLRPYIMEQMQIAHETGCPVIRPLFLDFPSDSNSWTVDDQYMFGPDILVAPILHEGAHERKVWLPNCPGGCVWVDAWTGDTIEGATWVDADAPLDRIPLFLRDGRDLPVVT